ncbi:hypothetical protein F7725_005472 [Dissostichus mawsoni]|uniref:Replication factor C subunit 1 n=1 Tax=Dissostichus mawsoni TaxID=36200 RepID=A0A7J5YUE7_DISMA|nr:hypothetical protein F7725_005472 [Dissostichus mawsoni]
MLQVKSSKTEEKLKDGDKKRKKQTVIVSDSDDEEPVRKSKKSPKEKQKKSKSETPPKKDPVQYVSETDSDSDSFQTLKKVSKTKPKQNGTAKQTKSDARPGAKEGLKSPVTPSSTKGKTAVKSPPMPVTPKSAPPPAPKHTPTSVLDYFGSAAVQRSEKKLVASTKRKAPTQDTDDLSDEQIAKQLQMHEDMELEKQVHDDEEFARTLAMLDEEPQAKKAIKNNNTKAYPPFDFHNPDDAEKKKNTAAFRNFLNRDGPRALGSKEIPQGAENCLEGCVFVLTGVMESMERDDAKSLIERYGGKVTGNISKKTTYMVQGRDSGVSKLEKAESFGTKILDEDGLLELISTKPGKKSKYEIAAEAENKASKTKTPPGRTSKSTPRSKKISPSKGNSCSPHTPSPSKTGLAPGRGAGTRGRDTPPGRGSAHTARRELGLSSSSASSPSEKGEDASLLWVDKYRPLSLKAVIGQQGDQSCANKLVRWLQNWYRHHGSGTSKPPVARFGKFGGGKDDGSGFKAALLSGPPGVGKTTTAALVCEELGLSFVEMNASCTRSKNSLKEVVSESLNNTSIEGFYKGTSQKVTNKHVLIMDEVDGMAGNEDRGGIQEMISLIKTSKIPIIFMCNDRNHMKIRSLANHCFDLRFQRPEWNRSREP